MNGALLFQSLFQLHQQTFYDSFSSQTTVYISLCHLSGGDKLFLDGNVGHFKMSCKPDCTKYTRDESGTF